jgi:hypothetical protein
VPTVATSAAAARLTQLGAPLVADGPAANVAAAAGSAAAFAAEIAALYQDPVRSVRQGVLLAVASLCIGRFLGCFIRLRAGFRHTIIERAHVRNVSLLCGLPQ